MRRYEPRNAFPTPRVTPTVTSTNLRRLLALTTLCTLALAGSILADEIMPLSQVRKGMKGYGLSVFDGAKVERFDVEILGVLNNIGPGQDLILAHVDSPVVKRAGVIAGMSGSPVYVDGKVIGALAYSWNFSKEPVAGITPIEEMLKIERSGTGISAPPGAAPRISAVELIRALSNDTPEELFAKAFGVPAPTAAVSMAGVRPISTPLSLSSFDSQTIARFGSYLDSMGFVAVPAGSTAAGTKNEQSPKNSKPFAPGDPIAGILLRGDFNIAATGTVTYVDGDRIYAFGHPFLDMGAISFPMARSEIVTVMPSLASSFKMSNTGETVGALTQDRSVGILGRVGANADTIPVELTVDGSGAAHTYHVDMVRNAQLSPLLLAMATDSVVSNAQRAAGERTVVLDSVINIKGFAPIHLREGWAGAQARQAIPAYLALVSGYLMSNEFQNAPIESVKIGLHHDDELRIAKLLEVSVEPPASGRIHPGDTVRVRALLKPFRGEAFTETLEVRIPDNQRPGSAYLLIGSGAVINQVDFSLVPPDPRTLEQVLRTLERLRPSTDLTVGLYASSEGAVTAGVYLPDLPPSIRAVVSNDSSNGAQAAVRYYAPQHVARSLDYIVDGAMKIDIEIRPQI
jgi:hypothetical protein